MNYLLRIFVTLVMTTRCVFAQDSEIKFYVKDHQGNVTYYDELTKNTKTEYGKVASETYKGNEVRSATYSKKPDKEDTLTVEQKVFLRTDQIKKKVKDDDLFHCDIDTTGSVPGRPYLVVLATDDFMIVEAILYESSMTSVEVDHTASTGTRGTTMKSTTSTSNQRPYVSHFFLVRGNEMTLINGYGKEEKRLQMYDLLIELSDDERVKEQFRLLKTLAPVKMKQQRLAWYALKAIYFSDYYREL